MVELLSPAGNFESLQAAVQNGADAIYFGLDSFSARAFASNFNTENLKQAINYAKLRGVKTHLTLNILIKNDELKESFDLAKKAYECGIDAIIVQDLGLGKLLIDSFPDIEIHASTQMTLHNLQGVLELENLGFKRAVLSRELSVNEIAYISQNSNIELECFIHGALCISYSGQCLFSSMIGGRSGNRGKCAQPCRLPYTLLENDQKIDSGYLLSPRDLCGIEHIPFLIKCGIKSFKIEGRMKSPEYVATVTRIYRKYIDIALSNKTYKISPEDKKDLLQVFNRGSSSNGHLDNNPNTNLVYKEKPNNMGLFLGIVQKYNNSKYITVKLNEPLNINDTISLENETGTYTVSELIEDDKNIKHGEIFQTVVIGRMKGNIKLGDKIYKMSSKILIDSAKESMKEGSKKIAFNCFVTIKKGKNISCTIKSANDLLIYKDLDVSFSICEIPVAAKNQPLTRKKVVSQITKTSTSPFMFKIVNVDIDDDLFVSKISSLNELRRIALTTIENYGLSNISKKIDKNKYNFVINILEENNKNLISHNSIFNIFDNQNKTIENNFKIALSLNILNLNFDYLNLKNVDKLYIPLKYFSIKEYSHILTNLSCKFNLYIILPTIVKPNYKNIIYDTISKSIKKYNIKGFILSNISNILLLEDLFDNKNFEFIANYTFNITNNLSVNELKNLGLDSFTISPELDKKSMQNICKKFSLQSELIVYGKIPVLNMNYCVLGNSNKCYPDCLSKCNSSNTYYLQDRLGFKFLIIPDNIQTITTVYNCKTLSICPSDFNINTSRIDILTEDISEINNIIEIVKSGKRLNGNDYTSGNLNRKF